MKKCKLCQYEYKDRHDCIASLRVAIEELKKKCLEREEVYKRGYDNGYTIATTRLEELEKKLNLKK